MLFNWYNCFEVGWILLFMHACDPIIISTIVTVLPLKIIQYTKVTISGLYRDKASVPKKPLRTSYSVPAKNLGTNDWIIKLQFAAYTCNRAGILLFITISAIPGWRCSSCCCAEQSYRSGWSTACFWCSHWQTKWGMADVCIYTGGACNSFHSYMCVQSYFAVPGWCNTFASGCQW